MILVEIPVRVISTPNARMHWAAKARLAKQHREAAYFVLCASKHNRPKGEIHIHLCRRYKVPGKTMDGDNLIAGFKAIRDGICDWLGRDDGSETIHWTYSQEPGTMTNVMIAISNM